MPKKKSILIVSFYNDKEELISAAKIYQQNINEDIYFFNCSNSLKFCDINVENDFRKCFECISDKSFVFNLLNIQDDKLINIDNSNNLDIDTSFINTIDELKSFEYKNINFGLYTYDFISSINKNKDINLKFLKKSIKVVINQLINLYNEFENLLNKNSFDEIYFYRSTHIIYRILKEFSISKKIDTYNFYINNNMVDIYNSLTLEKMNINIFVEKVENDYLLNGQKIKKIIYERSRKEIIKAINNYNNNYFANNIEAFKLFKDFEANLFIDKDDKDIIKNKLVEIYNKLDENYKKANETIKISACMIVKNEEKNIERCLQSIKDIVNEIIIVDTGSTDKTVDIAKKYTSKIYNHKWNNNFSYMRNISISYAKNDWILTIDADEELTEDTRKNLLISMYDEPIFDEALVFWFKCLNIYPDQEENTFYFKHFLFNKKHGFQFKGRIHEYIINMNDKDNDKSIKKQFYQFSVNHHHNKERDINKSKYYIKILEEELNNIETVKDKIYILSHLSNEYQKIKDDDKSLEISLDLHNLFQENNDLKGTLTYISNLIGLASSFIFNYLKFKEAKKYINEALKMSKGHIFSDILYLKALVEHETGNIKEAENLYIKLIDMFRSNDYDKMNSNALNSKGKTLYPFTIIQLYRLYFYLRKYDLALSILFKNNDNNYYLVNMFILRHFLLKKDLKNSLDSYFNNRFISNDKKNYINELLARKDYGILIHTIIDELLDTKEVFSEDEKKDLYMIRNSI